VGGRWIVKQGQLVTVDEHQLAEVQNKAARRLVNG
jgi:hypothetical protein